MGLIFFLEISVIFEVELGSTSLNIVKTVNVTYLKTVLTQDDQSGGTERRVFTHIVDVFSTFTTLYDAVFSIRESTQVE